MYILNQSGLEVLNSEYVERFCIVKKPDNTLIVASPGRDKQPTTLGRYESTEEARAVMTDLFNSLRYGEDSFEMPQSCAGADEHITRDARQKRRGGS